MSCFFLLIVMLNQDALFKIYGIQPVACQWLSELVANAIFIGKVTLHRELFSIPSLHISLVISAANLNLETSNAIWGFS